MDGRALTAVALLGILAGRAAAGSRGVVRRGREAIEASSFRVPIRIERQAEDDEEYIRRRMKKLGYSVEQAAASQLEAELEEAGATMGGLPIVGFNQDALRGGRFKGVYQVDVELLLPNRRPEDIGSDEDLGTKDRETLLAMRWPMKDLTREQAAALIQNNYFNEAQSLAGHFVITDDPVLVRNLG